MIEKGTDKPCVSAAILKDEETKLSGVEVSSICLSLVSGGFETIPGTLTSCIGSLSTPEGQMFQERAYEDIKLHYPTIEDAWAKSLEVEEVPYVNAIVKEAGRYVRKPMGTRIYCDLRPYSETPHAIYVAAA